MVTSCLTKAYSYLPSFSEEDRAYYKGMATAGTVFAAGAFLGWNSLINQESFTWKNIAVTLLGAAVFSGKSIPGFPDFQSRVENLHKEIIKSYPTQLQKNIAVYKSKCLVLGRELNRLPEEKRTPYLTLVLPKIRDFLLAKDSKSRQALLNDLKKILSVHLESRTEINYFSEKMFQKGVEEVGEKSILRSRLAPALLLGGLAIGAIWNINSIVTLISSLQLGIGLTFLYSDYSKKKFLSNNQRSIVEDEFRDALQSRNLIRIQLMTKTLGHPAFRFCFDISTFFRILFPTTTSALPKAWEKIVEKLPKSVALKKFEKEAPELQKTKDKYKSWKALLSELQKVEILSTNVLVEHLEKANPLFKRAWELAGKPKIRECPTSQVDSARYWTERHLIEINGEDSIQKKIEYIIFETFNALQRNAAFHIKLLAKDQNEVALFIEWVENFTANWFQKTIHSMGSPLKNWSFTQQWQKVNNPEGYRGLAHAEHYRICWMMDYILDNPGFLERRLRELA